MPDKDDKKKTVFQKRVSPESFVRAFPLPTRAPAAGEETVFQIVPSDATRAAEHGKRWRVTFSPVETPSEQMGLEIIGDAVIGCANLPEADIDINFVVWHGEERGVSQRHALLRPARDKLFLMDLGSTNGTHYNGFPLTTDRVQALQQGDLITFGRLHVRIKAISSVEAPPAKPK